MFGHGFPIDGYRGGFHFRERCTYAAAQHSPARSGTKLFIRKILTDCACIATGLVLVAALYTLPLFIVNKGNKDAREM